MDQHLNSADSTKRLTYHTDPGAERALLRENLIYHIAICHDNGRKEQFQKCTETTPFSGTNRATPAPPH